MKSEDIIRMAREARLAEPYHPMNPWSASQEALERFAALVAAQEREACAKVCEDCVCEVCEDLVAQYELHNNFICAKAIRARGGE